MRRSPENKKIAQQAMQKVFTYISPRTLAQECGVTRQTAYKWLKAGAPLDKVQTISSRVEDRVSARELYPELSAFI